MSNDEYLFEIDKFELLGNIGSGQFAIVFKTREKSSGNIYAAKILRKVLSNDTDEKSIIQNLVREVSIISKLDHPSIIQFIGFSPKDFHNNPKPVIVTEYATNGSLRSLIESDIRGLSDHRWNDTQKLITLYGIASAMSYLHSYNIIHRDLKPENILMNEDLYPKVGDFGLSKILHLNEDSLTAASKSGFKGTFLYSAPETLVDNKYSTAGDVYAFGMIAYEILTSQIPFEKFPAFKLIQKVSNGERPEFKCKLPDSYINLIETCWAQEPTERPTFDQIVIDLKTDEGFITNTIDEVEFLTYVEYIDNYKISFKSDSSVASLDEFLLNYDKNNDFYQTVESFKTEKSIRLTNVNFAATEDELIGLFKQFGDVSKVYIVHTLKGKPKGVCLIEFQNEQSYFKAINYQYPLYSGDRVLKISPMPPNDTIVLLYLPENTTEADIKCAFTEYNITEIKFAKYSKKNKLIAYVKFESEKIRKIVSDKKTVVINDAELPLLVSVSLRVRSDGRSYKRRRRKYKKQ